VNVSIAGITTIRANSAESEFEAKFDKVQDFHTATWFLCLVTSRWLGIWVDLLCSVYIGIVIGIMALSGTSEPLLELLSRILD